MSNLCLALGLVLKAAAFGGADLAVPTQAVPVAADPSLVDHLPLIMKLAAYHLGLDQSPSEGMIGGNPAVWGGSTPAPIGGDPSSWGPNMDYYTACSNEGRIITVGTYTAIDPACMAEKEAAATSFIGGNPATWGPAVPAPFGSDPNTWSPQASFGSDPNTWSPQASFGSDPNTWSPQASFGSDPNTWSPQAPFGSDPATWSPSAPYGSDPATWSPAVPVTVGGNPATWGPAIPAPFGSDPNSWAPTYRQFDGRRLLQRPIANAWNSMTDAVDTAASATTNAMATAASATTNTMDTVASVTTNAVATAASATTNAVTTATAATSNWEQQAAAAISQPTAAIANARATATAATSNWEAQAEAALAKARAATTDAISQAQGTVSNVASTAAFVGKASVGAAMGAAAAVPSAAMNGAIEGALGAVMPQEKADCLTTTVKSYRAIEASGKGEKPLRTVGGSCAFAIALNRPTSCTNALTTEMGIEKSCAQDVYDIALCVMTDCGEECAPVLTKLIADQTDSLSIPIVLPCAMCSTQCFN